MTRDAGIYGAGAILLGIAGLIFMSFALQWQPVPQSLSGSVPLIIVSAASLIACGVLLLVPQTTYVGGVCSAVVFALWFLLLHVPRMVASGGGVVELLGGAEIGALALAGALWSLHRRASDKRLMRLLTALFGVCAVVFGISHFVYAEFTATMVPAWLPARLGWAYFTGACHCAAGLALIAGFKVRLAAGLLAAMCLGFVLLVHVVGVATEPNSQLQWTALGMALLIAGSAWIVRSVSGIETREGDEPAL